MANGKQVEGLPVSQPGDRPTGMAQAVGEAISSQIIPGNRLRDAHSYSLCVKWAVVKLAFSSFSCHWAEKYELWADAPGWEPVAGLWPPCALPRQGLPPARFAPSLHLPPPLLLRGSLPGFTAISYLISLSPLLFPSLSHILSCPCTPFPGSCVREGTAFSFLTIVLSLAPSTRQQ